MPLEFYFNFLVYIGNNGSLSLISTDKIGKIAKKDAKMGFILRES